MEPGINMITLGVEDVERPARSYETVFSAKRTGRSISKEKTLPLR